MSQHRLRRYRCRHGCGSEIFVAKTTEGSDVRLETKTRLVAVHDEVTGAVKVVAGRARHECPSSKTAAFSFGRDRAWPGLGKLVEEAGEVLQVCGKLLGTDGATAHWDGTDLRERLTEELGDLLAAADFVIERCRLDPAAVTRRREEKGRLFRDWDEVQGG